MRLVIPSFFFPFLSLGSAILSALLYTLIPNTAFISIIRSQWWTLLSIWLYMEILEVSCPLASPTIYTVGYVIGFIIPIIIRVIEYSFGFSHDFTNDTIVASTVFYLSSILYLVDVFLTDEKSIEAFTGYSWGMTDLFDATLGSSLYKFTTTVHTLSNRDIETNSRKSDLELDFLSRATEEFNLSDGHLSDGRIEYLKMKKQYFPDPIRGFMEGRSTSFGSVEDPLSLIAATQIPSSSSHSSSSLFTSTESKPELIVSHSLQESLSESSLFLPSSVQNIDPDKTTINSYPSSSHPPSTSLSPSLPPSNHSISNPSSSSNELFLKSSHSLHNNSLFPPPLLPPPPPPPLLLPPPLLPLPLLPSHLRRGIAPHPSNLDAIYYFQTHWWMGWAMYLPRFVYLNWGFSESVMVEKGKMNRFISCLLGISFNIMITINFYFLMFFTMYFRKDASQGSRKIMKMFIFYVFMGMLFRYLFKRIGLEIDSRKKFNISMYFVGEVASLLFYFTFYRILFESIRDWKTFFLFQIVHLLSEWIFYPLRASKWFYQSVVWIEDECLSPCFLKCFSFFSNSSSSSSTTSSSPSINSSQHTPTTTIKPSPFQPPSPSIATSSSSSTQQTILPVQSQSISETQPYLLFNFLKRPSLSFEDWNSILALDFGLRLFVLVSAGLGMLLLLIVIDFSSWIQITLRQTSKNEILLTTEFIFASLGMELLNVYLINRIFFNSKRKRLDLDFFSPTFYIFSNPKFSFLIFAVGANLFINPMGAFTKDF